jgi:hypothetical protein
MTQEFSSVSFTYTVSDIAFRGTLIPTPVSNEFDWIGSLLGLPRFPNERNDSYRERLLDVFVHRANSTYTGLIHGITRELNLDLFQPVRIQPVGGVDSTWAPRIQFKDNIVYIWKDWNTQLLDIEIDRGDPTSSAYHLTGLVAAINTSEVFTATLLNSDWGILRADTICNQISSTLVEEQPLQPSTTNYLGNPRIDRGSVIFSDVVTFANEVNDADDVVAAGQYHIDYSTGLITSGSAPSDNSVIRYSFMNDPFEPIASPVIIRAINSPEFQKVMFNQVPAGDLGTDVSNGTATIKGAAIINELLSVVPMYWGR